LVSAFSYFSDSSAFTLSTWERSSPASTSRDDLPRQQAGVLIHKTGVLTQYTAVLTQYTGVLTLYTGVLTQYTGVLTQYTDVLTECSLN